MILQKGDDDYLNECYDLSCHDESLMSHGYEDMHDLMVSYHEQNDFFDD